MFAVRTRAACVDVRLCVAVAVCSLGCVRVTWCTGFALALVWRCRELNLNKNSLSTPTGVSLSEMLVRAASLQELSLAWNQLRLQGVKALADPLTSNVGAQLRVLDLSWNSLNSEGAQVVGALLRANTSLQTVDLSHNNIHGKGAMVLAAGVNQAEGLTNLNLAGNPLGESGVKALLRCMGKQDGCRNIDLLNCSMDLDSCFDPSKPSGTYVHLLTRVASPRLGDSDSVKQRSGFLSIWEISTIGYGLLIRARSCSHSAHALTHAHADGCA